MNAKQKKQSIMLTLFCTNSNYFNNDSKTMAHHEYLSQNMSKLKKTVNTMKL